MSTKDFLHKYIEAQEDKYFVALQEIRSGRKSSHWIWFIFPTNNIEEIFPKPDIKK